MLNTLAVISLLYFFFPKIKLRWVSLFLGCVSKLGSHHEGMYMAYVQTTYADDQDLPGRAPEGHLGRGASRLLIRFLYYLLFSLPWQNTRQMQFKEERGDLDSKPKGIESKMSGMVWQQKQEKVAGHCMHTAGSWGNGHLCSAGFSFLFSQPGTSAHGMMLPAHGMVLSALRVGLPNSVNITSIAQRQRHA